MEANATIKKASGSVRCPVCSSELTVLSGARICSLCSFLIRVVSLDIEPIDNKQTSCVKSKNKDSNEGVYEEKER
jgi:hypothetical protein